MIVPEEAICLFIKFYQRTLKANILRKIFSRALQKYLRDNKQNNLQWREICSYVSLWPLCVRKSTVFFELRSQKSICNGYYLFTTSTNFIQTRPKHRQHFGQKFILN